MLLESLDADQEQAKTKLTITGVCFLSVAYSGAKAKENNTMRKTPNEKLAELALEIPYAPMAQYIYEFALGMLNQRKMLVTPKLKRQYKNVKKLWDIREAEEKKVKEEADTRTPEQKKNAGYVSDILVYIMQAHKANEDLDMCKLFNVIIDYVEAEQVELTEQEKTKQEIIEMINKIKRQDVLSHLSIYIKGIEQMFEKETL